MSNKRGRTVLEDMQKPRGSVLESRDDMLEARQRLNDTTLRHCVLMKELATKVLVSRFSFLVVASADVEAMEWASKTKLDTPFKQFELFNTLVEVNPADLTGPHNDLQMNLHLRGDRAEFRGVFRRQVHFPYDVHQSIVAALMTQIKFGSDDPRNLGMDLGKSDDRIQRYRFWFLMLSGEAADALETAAVSTDGSG